MCFREDPKHASDHQLILASSLATILWKYFNVKSQSAQQLIDRCPLFVNKDRQLKSKLLREKKKVLDDKSLETIENQFLWLVF